MAPTTVPPDTLPRAVAEAALGHALDALRDAREERDTWRDMTSQVLHRVARQTGIVRSQTATIRRLLAERERQTAA